jgi:hypothetical protein
VKENFVFCKLLKETMEAVDITAIVGEFLDTCSHSWDIEVLPPCRENFMIKMFLRENGRILLQRFVHPNIVISVAYTFGDIFGHL